MINSCSTQSCLPRAKLQEASRTPFTTTDKKLMEDVPISYPGHGTSEDVELPSSAFMIPDDMMLPYDYHNFISSEFFHHICLASSGAQSSSYMLLDSEVDSFDGIVTMDGTTDDYYQVQFDHSAQEKDEMDMLMVKNKILHHPLFPRMLRAYAECEKFGGEMLQTNSSIEMELHNGDVSIAFETDPQLDEFLETYCEILEKLNEDVGNTFRGVTSFLNSMEMQLTDLCGTLSTASLYDEDSEYAVISSAEEKQPTSAGANGDQTTYKCNNNRALTDLKMNLVSKYGSGHLRNLKLDFSKRTKKKKGKLPCQARQVLVNWWFSHHSWPYPTEADKVELTKMTGLLPKQINNWFINQRKRHWKIPVESLQYSLVDNNLSTGKNLNFFDEEFDVA